MALGERIKEARKRKGFTQEQLANLCDLATITIRQYELGKREPRAEQLIAIATALGVSVAYLQGYETIDTREILDAMRRKDYSAAEKLMGLPAGSITPIPDDEVESINAELEQQQQTTNLILNKLRIYLKTKYLVMTEHDFASIKALIDSFSQLTAEGQKKAIERVEELTQIPKYKI